MQADWARLRGAGVHRIVLPGAQQNLTTHTDGRRKKYFAVVFWTWPDESYLRWLARVVSRLKKHDGTVKAVAVCDDQTVSLQHSIA